MDYSYSIPNFLKVDIIFLGFVQVSVRQLCYIWEGMFSVCHLPY